MKKINFLMLFALAILLLGCREELVLEQTTREASIQKHSQNSNTATFREFLETTQSSNDLFSSNKKDNLFNEFEIDTSYILKRMEQGNVNAFSFLLKKKTEASKNVVYNMFYYKGKLGNWKHLIVKIIHDPNPQRLYGWKKTSLYKLSEMEFNKGCYSSMEFGNVDWFQCSAGHSSNCSRNGGACCAGCHHSMAVSYWVNTCDEAAPGNFDVNYGGGAGGNPITMEDIKTALQNNVSSEVYNKFLLLPFNLQQGVIDCLYNDFLVNDLLTSVITFLYDYPNTQNPDLIYYRLKDIQELMQQNTSLSPYDFAVLFSLQEITSASLLNETILDWKDINRIKPTLKFKKNPLVNCVYNKAKTAANFNQYLKNFNGKFSTAHLMFDLQPLDPAHNAETTTPLGYWIKITINSNNLNRPSLDIARTFMHEIIHAEMFRILLSLASTSNGEINLTELINMLNSHNYPGIYDYFRRYELNDMQHEQMAAHYRGIVKNFLKQIDNSLTDDQYEAIAWQGLQGTERWNQLSASQKTNINLIYSNWYNAASHNCP